ncbi:hypothetical protein KKG72_04870 [bacterium]|nr:hypothetical protein [bacterium]
MELKSRYPFSASKITKQKEITRMDMKSFLFKAFENKTKSTAKSGGKNR